ncbi:pca operon transcription factor PcaQ [Agrobacterium vitis]|uniref:HTH-type transcriptional regulator PcaQ n=1 Tax=Agrobacterium vitis TaxID=373 RepID=A0A368P055_AGRVI|nr:pca operon transcription factor PcaQ [Agrobacterium vitis]KAA3511384.1 pca operon transcription factor PcaQ [Agrobacterium vitis]KAA3528085.1 pca operon transcription factor PcaQ [Agrobacterium vitis]MCF1478427.1 pca operon transcription factor PcaQ [Agrobacterium vitis]MUZ96588.1 pca operon transcription factor PcaQ [Agrobacterium vitis]MVA28559.1 pca operon transcription factor PcaQ [Agrobacterium vitis]
MIDQRIKFRHLQTFVEVARQKSVVKSANLLHVSQPAVTKTVRELEEILGVSLFEREGRGIRITRYGEVFLRHAGATLTALRHAVDSVSQEAAKAGPPVRVGALPTVATRIMPQAMTAFLKENTGSPIKIVTGDNSVLLEQLRIGELDLVVGRLAAPEKMTGFSFEHLYSEPVVFVVRSGHPLLTGERAPFERMREFPVLMPIRNSIIRPLVDYFLIANGVATLPNQIETVSDSFGRAFLKISDAVWVISEGVVAGDIAEGTIHALPIDSAPTRGPVGLTIRADAVATLPQSLLMQAIRDAAAASMPAQ